MTTTICFYTWAQLKQSLGVLPHSSTVTIYADLFLLLLLFNEYQHACAMYCVVCPSCLLESMGLGLLGFQKHACVATRNHPNFLVPINQDLPTSECVQNLVKYIIYEAGRK